MKVVKLDALDSGLFSDRIPALGIEFAALQSAGECVREDDGRFCRVKLLALCLFQ